MRLTARVLSWFRMFAHQMREIARGNWHREWVHTKGFMIFGVYVGWVFVERHCDTCGYRP